MFGQAYTIERLQAKALQNPAVIIRAEHDHMRFMVVFQHGQHNDILTGYLSFEEAQEFCNLINMQERETVE